MNVKQTGISLLEILVWLVIVAALAAFVVDKFAGVRSGANLEFASAEIQQVKSAAETYRMTSAQRRRFTNISVTRLAERGYNVEPLVTGENENVYGLSVTVAPANNATDATLTYETPEPEDCIQLVDRFTNESGVKGVPSCSGNVLTLTIE